MDEIWKPIEGYEGYYEVSNLGRVRSLERFIQRKGTHGGQTVHGKIKSQETNNKGYLMVNLMKNNRTRVVTVHRLVATAFVENPSPKEFVFVNHKDENTLNNRAENLEWCTPKYNSNYGTNIERIRNRSCEASGIHPVETIVTFPSGAVTIFPSMKNASKMLGVSKKLICDIRNGKRKSNVVNGMKIEFRSHDYTNLHLEDLPF